MSDVSILSKQFDRLVKLSNQFNEAVIGLKKNTLTSKKQNDKRIKENKEHLIFFLKNILELIRNENQSSESELSSPLFENFRKRINSYSFVEDKLKNLLTKLESDKKLREEDFRLMDNILSELDNERNVLFKKLRSGRG